MYQHAQKMALVTGAGRGIGQAIAAAYAHAGYAVIIADRDETAGIETEQKLRSSGGNTLFIQTDVGDPSSIQHLFRQVEERFGRLDVLINNAGLSVFQSPFELTVDDWDRILNTNLRSVFLCSREAARLMQHAGRGAIVNIASTRAHMSEPHAEAYAASKGGILALTHSLAVSLSPLRITVNAISPGWIETGDYEALRDIDHAQHPAGRVGKPEDIARACLFLTDERNDFITGSELIIDGGMTRKMIYEP